MSRVTCVVIFVLQVALQGLVELERASSLKSAEVKGDKIVQFISQIVEYDGWCV